jgi:hypothetical protein
MSYDPAELKSARKFCLFFGGLFAFVGCLEIWLVDTGVLGAVFSIWGSILFFPALLLPVVWFTLVYRYVLRWVLFPIRFIGGS